MNNNNYNYQSLPQLSKILTELPERAAISLSLLKTPVTVKGGGVYIVRCVDLLPMATRPRSPLSATSDLMNCGLRPKNEVSYYNH